MLKQLFPALIVLLAAAPLPAQTPLRVAAAADLEPVLPPLLAEFEQQTGIRAEATYQASAALTTLIQNGAPFDVFLAADLGYPKRLIDGGLADSGGLSDGSAPVIYAKGTLVLWTRKDAHLRSPSLTLLSDPSLKRLAMANPDRAPYGKAALAALQSLKLYGPLQSRIVTAENIAQTAQFVESGNAQLGLISLTAAESQHFKEIGTYVLVPFSEYPEIRQYAVLMAKSDRKADAHAFLDWLLSPAVQDNWAKVGLDAVK